MNSNAMQMREDANVNVPNNQGQCKTSHHKLTAAYCNLKDLKTINLIEKKRHL